ncbi:hypothetical protein [Thiocapsa marina]|uniref:Uncharacterized protein n=1 Tax=Thiocapsa marina 5811 TaxID=768671 RepID=F9UDL7_9GAMM|nr:hypothetical protein [Thiocapsa marina]EGV17664.1 hypothetical protein ThimaDRAFT_3209 [Thiocapsa marina 5811]
MSFDALTITGLVAAVLCAGFLVALINRDDAGGARPSRIRGTDKTDGSDCRS